MKITIKHQEEKTFHTYEVQDPKNLTSTEVKNICEKMGVKSLFVNGKFYELK
jgi:hypothetical protein